MLPVGNAQQQMFGGYIDEDGGGLQARIKVKKLAQSIFNNQQWLEAAMEGRGGGGAMEVATATAMKGTMAMQ
jgi:hypothetical protein